MKDLHKIRDAMKGIENEITRSTFDSIEKEIHRYFPTEHSKAEAFFAGMSIVMLGPILDLESHEMTCAMCYKFSYPDESNQTNPTMTPFTD